MAVKPIGAVLDLLYPPRCGVCGALGDEPICGTCREGFLPHPDLGASIREAMLDSIYAPFLYPGHAGLAVRRLKIDRATLIARPLADLVAECLTESGLLHEVDLVLPVPIHWRRRAWRGFNQSELLCEGLPRSIVQRGPLLKIRHTRPQVGLPAELRRQNLDGAFRAALPRAGLRILLVDDVVTTGTTARECARALREAGAASVSLFALTAGS